MKSKETGGGFVRKTNGKAMEGNVWFLWNPLPMILLFFPTVGFPVGLTEPVKTRVSPCQK
jgi:hypothetical protein